VPEKYHDIGEIWAPRFEGEKIAFRELIGEDIVIFDFYEGPSQFQEGKTYVLISAEHAGVKIVTATSAQAVKDSLRKARELNLLPVICRVVEKTSKSGKRKYLALESAHRPEIEKLEA